MRRLLFALLLPALPLSADDGLGRLFHTPEEREAIDRAARTPYRLIGELTRGADARTRWYAGDAPPVAPAPLAVGETFTPGASTIQPLLPPGSLRRHRPPSPP